ncbi:MAG: class I SAM-dependent methyltransferase [FCB group bacterium]|nr:class I SAM-dependent methyltransferase [FCB group bacterium]
MFLKRGCFFLGGIFLFELFLFPGKPSVYGQTTTKSMHNNSRNHRFQNAEQWAERFEDPARDEWQKPEIVIAAMGIRQNSRLADIGSATGYFPVRFARVASAGHVYGVDVEPDMVRYLNERATDESLTNLTSILGAYNDPKIPEPVDFIFICNTYHHIQQRQKYFENLKRYFLPGGQLIIVDFKKGPLPIGPPDTMKLSPEQIIMELTEAGYVFIPGNVPLPYQFFLRFSPVAE